MTERYMLGIRVEDWEEAAGELLPFWYHKAILKRTAEIAKARNDRASAGFADRAGRARPKRGPAAAAPK